MLAGMARGEIAAVSPDIVRERHIPDAKNQLDAIIAETESATDNIMTAAERIEQIAGCLNDPENKPNLEQVTNEVMNIYQACSFQDITGQRVTKVVKVLQSIESTVETILAALGDDQARRRLDDLGQQNIDMCEDAHILSGPQLKGGGKSQDDIDNILASFD